MRQTTKFYAVLLCAALGFSTSIQSCKDYDDDIDSLNKRIDAVNKSLEDLKKDFGALAFVKDVKWDESTRTLTITPATGNPVTYTIADADTKDGNTQYTLETKAEGKTVTITLKNDKGEVISAPTITMPDTPAEFDGTKLTIGEKGAILYDGEPTGATLPQVTIPGMTITEIKDAAGTVIGYTIKYGDNEPVNLKLISEKLQGLVFIPDFYYQGIEAMAANTFYYKALTLPTVNANDDFSTDKATEGQTFSLTPNLVANYHLNPSNAAVSDLKKENMFFIAEDKAYTKAGAHNVEVTDFKVNKGVLTVQAGLNKGMLKDIEKDGEVTVLALANLGAHPGFIGKIGNDDFGQYFKKNGLKQGIDMKLLAGDLPTGVASTFISPDGERTFGTYLGAAATMKAENLTLDMFKGYAYLYIEGYLVQDHELILRAMQLGKEAGLQICLDMASYNIVEGDLEFFDILITKYVDIVFANEEEAKAYTGNDDYWGLLIIGAFSTIVFAYIGYKIIRR